MSYIQTYPIRLPSDFRTLLLSWPFLTLLLRDSLEILLTSLDVCLKVLRDCLEFLGCAFIIWALLLFSPKSTDSFIIMGAEQGCLSKTSLTPWLPSKLSTSSSPKEVRLDKGCCGLTVADDLLKLLTDHLQNKDRKIDLSVNLIEVIFIQLVLYAPF